MGEGALVVLTREPPDNDSLAASLSAAGFRVLEYPCIRSRCLPVNAEAMREAARCDLVAFSSRRAVEAITPLREELLHSRPLLAAVGPATARAIFELLGRTADVVPGDHHGAALAREISRRLEGSTRLVLHLRGSESIPDFSRILRENGCAVREMVVYETNGADLRSLPFRGQTVVVFASPSAAEAFFAANTADAPDRRYVAIGHRTGRSLTSRGIADYLVADLPDPEALVDAVLRSTSHEGSTPCGES